MRSTTPPANSHSHSNSNSSSNAATYTTIPIPGTEVILRSFQNVSSFINLRRPWPEVIAGTGSFDRPDSLSAAGNRLQLNFKYFLVNYSILISICAALSLLGSPGALIVFAFVFTLWLVLYFFREDPMVAWGHHVDDRVVMLGLVSVTALAFWLVGLSNLLVGIGIGALIAAVHGVFRNPEGLFLDENDAASAGLIGSRVPRGKFSV